MGEVYRARDTRLERTVAVKILPESLATDQDRLQRFEQEARILSTLNHPNLLAIYDVGSQRGIHYLVSEFLEGQTLRDLLIQGPLPARKATDYGLQIAKGLASAHEKSIIHRDLKPENIFVSSDGRVKILDFGLAKLSASGQQNNAGATLTVQTVPGVVLGTVGYMSPEQVRGQPADARSDLFALGTILYEMLSGSRAFQGATPADTMTAILKEDPPPAPNGHQIPLPLESIVGHCLEKNPQQRFQSAQDVAFNLELLSHSSGSRAAVAAPPDRLPRGRWSLLAGVGVVAVAMAAFFAGEFVHNPAKPAFHQLTFQRGRVLQARFSPDGQTIVYSAAWNGLASDIYSTRADRPGARSLDIKGGQLLSVASTGDLAVLVKTSPLGTFADSGTLALLPLSGGAPREVAERVLYADFSPDGTQLAIVRDQGPRNRLEYPVGKLIYEFTGWLSHPRISPGGDRIVFVEHPEPNDTYGSLVVMDLSGKRTVLKSGAYEVIDPAWNPRGDEVWYTTTETGGQRSIHAVDLKGKERVLLEVPGNLVLKDVFHDGRVLLIRESQRREANGIVSEAASERDFSWFDWTFPSDISPDGSTFVFHEAGAGGGRDFALFLRKTDGSPPIQLGTGNGGFLSPDGKWVLCLQAHSPAQVLLLPTGVGEARQVTNDTLDHLDVKWLPDGKSFVFLGAEPGHNTRLYLQDLQGGSPKAISSEGYNAYMVSASPDGKYIVVQCPDLKPCLIPLAGGPPRPIPGGEVSDSPAQWSQDGRSLFVYQYGALPATLWRVDVVTGKRTVFRSLAPPDLAGVHGITIVVLTRDTRVILYSYLRTFSDLYLVQGIN
jgi:eukaryotic-like serine/threonine-protein kinase